MNINQIEMPKLSRNQALAILKEINKAVKSGRVSQKDAQSTIGALVDHANKTK